MKKGLDKNGDRMSSDRAPIPRGTRAQNQDEFVRLELSKEEMQQLRSFCNDFDELDAAVEGLLADGYKFSIKGDDRGNGVVAFCFAPFGDGNDGFILSGRGGTLSRAIRQLVFKHSVLLDGDWAGYHNRATDSNGDDW